MDYKTHAITAVGVWTAILYYFGLLEATPAIAASLGIALLGGLFPDIDHQQSKINNLTELGLSMLIAFSIAVHYLSTDDTFLPLAFVAATTIAFMQTLRHRKLFHSLWFGVAIAVALYFFNIFAAEAFLVGFASHVAVDKIKRK